MSRFIAETMSDIRGGRESWRVLLTLTLPAFVLAIAMVALGHIH